MSSGTLGYMDLISMAQANSREKERELERRQRLRSEKKKKEDPKQQKLKLGVARFIEKKEEEERKKKEEADRKRRQLLALRGQDRKATSRVNRMLKMTKSANKAVIADAVECLEEATNAQAQVIQPDEDDYGYTSQYANDMYKKVLEKYQADAVQAEKHKTVGNSTKIEHVKKNKHTEVGGHGSPTSPSEQKKENKKKKALPPPPSFNDLLKLAEEKSKEPILIPKPVKEASEGPEFEFGRPMTKKEKREFLAEQELRKRAEAAFSDRGNVSKVTTPAKSDAFKGIEGFKSKNSPIPKIKPAALAKPIETKTVTKPHQDVPSVGSRREINISSSASTPSQSFDRHAFKEKGVSNPVDNRKAIPSHSGVAKPPRPMQVDIKKSSNEHSMKNQIVNNTKSKEVGSKEPRHAPKMQPAPPPQYPPQKRDREVYSKQGNAEKPREKRERERERHSKEDVAPSSSKKPFLPNPYLDRYNDPRPPHIRHNINSRELDRGGRLVIESDEEEDYDSEMDDFIDDSEEPVSVYSKEISKIFGYDRKKYVDNDDDDIVESSFAQQMREEQQSKRAGKLEDEEDMRREEEEKKRKAQMLKRRKVK